MPVQSLALKVLLSKVGKEIAGKLPEILIETQKTAMDGYKHTLTTAVDGYKHHTTLKQQRYLTELENRQRESDRVHTASEAALDREHRVMENELSRRHERDMVCEHARVDLWSRAEAQEQRRRRKLRPFTLPPDDVHRLAIRVTGNGVKPLLLIAPFSDESQSGVESDEGPRRYRTGLRNAWGASPWSGRAVCYNGLVSRPLRHGDVDVDLIHQELVDLPVVLINGEIQASARLWLTVIAWGVVPGDSGIRVQFPALPLPDLRGLSDDAAKNEHLAFEDLVAMQTTRTVAQLLDWFHLLKRGETPLLQSALPDDPEVRRIVAAGNLAAFLVAEGLGVLSHVDGLVGAARVAMEGGLTGSANEFLSDLREAVGRWDEAVSVRTLDELKELGKAAAAAGEAPVAKVADYLVGEVARRLLMERPGEGL